MSQNQPSEQLHFHLVCVMDRQLRREVSQSQLTATAGEEWGGKREERKKEMGR